MESKTALGHSESSKIPLAKDSQQDEKPKSGRLFLLPTNLESAVAGEIV
jgi:hypothetical protein